MRIILETADGLRDTTDISSTYATSVRRLIRPMPFHFAEAAKINVENLKYSFRTYIWNGRCDANDVRIYEEKFDYTPR